MQVLIRVFRASVKPGLNDEFQSFFINQALPLVSSQEGMQRATIGLPSEEKPRESHLLVETAVDHYYQVEG